MNDWYEALKGFSDLPLAFVAVWCGSLLWRRERNAAGLFLCVAVEALLGTAVHAFVRTAVGVAALWTLLYPLLFETVRRLAVFLLDFIGAGTAGERPFARVAQGLLCAAAVAAAWCRAPFDILLLAVYAAWQAGRVVLCGIRAKRWPGDMTVLVCAAGAVVLLQTFSAYIPYAVVAEHLLMLAALWWLYRMAAGKIGKSEKS